MVKVEEIAAIATSKALVEVKSKMFSSSGLDSRSISS